MMSERKSRERAGALIHPHAQLPAYIREEMVNSIAAALRAVERETFDAFTKAMRELEELRA